MSGPFQVEFFFSGPPLNADSGAAARTDYAGFNLNGIEYKVGDCAFLYPEDEAVPPYLGRILGCFHDRSGRAADPHCVEVAWFERRAHLEPADPQGRDWENEVVALEETDINAIGCISGKAVVLKAGGYEEASQMAKSISGVEWFFCRGVYNQSENCIVPYPELAEQLEDSNDNRPGKRSQTGVPGDAEGVADSDEVKRQRVAEEQLAAPVRRTGKLVSGRTCVECGATQTPQWREGPAGPKTLCNACGVRYVRAQQRANKRAVAMGVPRASCGSGGRQSRSAKAAKADAASARAARATAAAAAEEASQRPLRQAALMAASKTAQYARTGIFPQSATELQHFDGAGGLTAQQQQQDATAAMAAMYGVPALGAAAQAAQARPGTPNCSSYDSSVSLHDGVTVEVVVGPVDGDGDCCGEASDHCTAAAAAIYPLVAPSAPLLPHRFAGMVPADQSALGVAPVVVVLAARDNQAASAQHLPAGLLRMSPDPAASAADGCSLFSTAAGCRYDEHDCFGDAHPQCPATGCGPALSGDVVGPECTGYAASSGVESPAAQVVSAPVSPSARCSFGCYDLDDAGLGEDLHLHGVDVDVYGGQLGCGMGVGLDDEYGSLGEVEVDFGLGTAEAIGSGEALFGELHHTSAGDGHHHHHHNHHNNDDDNDGVASAADLPAVAARAAAFCSDLAPGSDARDLLDAMPALVEADLGAGDEQLGAAAAAPSAPASAAMPTCTSLPDDAVTQLVSLGRQASRATTEALAADAALQAVSQVLEAHQEAARRAARAAAANFGRLKDCITTLAGSDPGAVAEMGGHLIDLRDLGGSGSLAGLAGCCFDGAELVAVHS